MKILIEIPKEFESLFEFDRFADSLARVASDIEAHGFELSGRYERETITMIRKAFENATPLPKGYGVLVEGKEVLREIYDLRHRASIFSNNDKIAVLDELIRFVDLMPVIVEAEKEGEEDETD